MQVHKVNISTLGEPDPHEGEPFWCQTIVLGSVGTFVPLRATRVDPVVVGEGVKTRTEGHTTRRGGPIWVGVVLIQSSMVIEVLWCSQLSRVCREYAVDETYLLNVYDIVGVLGEYLQSIPNISDQKITCSAASLFYLAYEHGVRRLIRFSISVQNFGETCC